MKKISNIVFYCLGLFPLSNAILSVFRSGTIVDLSLFESLGSSSVFTSFKTWVNSNICNLSSNVYLNFAFNYFNYLFCLMFIYLLFRFITYIFSFAYGFLERSLKK